MGGKRAVVFGWLLRRRVNKGKNELRFRFWLLVATAAVVLLVSGLLGAALLQEYWFTPRRAVATIGEYDITLRTLQQHTRYRRVQLLNQYFIYSDLLQYVGERRDQLQDQLDQIQEQLDEPLRLSEQVLEELIFMELVRAEALARGIKVGPDEIEAAANAYFGYDVDVEARIPVPTATINQVSDSEPVSTPVSTPTPYTEAAYHETYAAHLEKLSADTGMTETSFLAMFEQRLLSEKLRDAMALELDIAEEEHVHARHILVSLHDMGIAQDVLKRALEAEEFAVLAAEFSIDSANAGSGGDLGWFPRGQMVAAFEKPVFSADIGVIPELVATQFGLHVVEILGKEMRVLPETILAQRRNQALDKWLFDRRNEAGIEILNWWEALAPNEPTLQDYYARMQLTEQRAD